MTTGNRREIVISPLGEFECATCGDSGDLLTMDDAGLPCLACAELDHLVWGTRSSAMVDTCRGMMLPKRPSVVLG